MGGSYVLHTPEALRDALRRGSLAVQSSVSRGTVLSAAAAQHAAAQLTVNLAALPEQPDLPALAPADDKAYRRPRS